MGLRTSGMFSAARRWGPGGLNKPLSASGITYERPKRVRLPEDKTKPAYGMTPELFECERPPKREKVQLDGVVKRPCIHCGEFTGQRVKAGEHVFDCGCRSTRAITTAWVAATNATAVTF